MRPMTVLSILLAVLAASLLGCGSDQTESENSPLSVYVDPNGYFAILPPAGWRVQRYRNEPRGKVAFFASEGTEMRVLVKAVDSTDYDEQLENAKELEKELGIEMNIEPVDFVGLPAIKRVTTFTTQGVTKKFLVIDLLIDGASHNLQYSAPPNVFDRHYNAAWLSMLSYKPLTRTMSPSAEDVREHESARWIRLAGIALEMGDIQTAKDFVAVGLEADPENAELNQMQSDLAAR